MQIVIRIISQIYWTVTWPETSGKRFMQIRSLLCIQTCCRTDKQTNTTETITSIGGGIKYPFRLIYYNIIKDCPCNYQYPSKHDALTQCCFNVGRTSETAANNKTTLGQCLVLAGIDLHNYIGTTP